ncbi:MULTISPECIES: hypothetical protein [Lysobacter]|jgi:hypothetical protein|uniref:Uncharacterized protein n=1 Tax=Lysobacter auxotrophicus TaxID=2992573 RepID=A0ABM8D8K4_9GAMM|nr:MULTISPECIES: hypothetical protein [Lysobacter]BDU14878.1 hypothetical protein LA521A_00790 [Lysobacter auxotrophicus]
MGSVNEGDKQRIGLGNQQQSQRPEEPAGPVAGHNEDRRTGVSGQLDEEHDGDDAENGEQK